MIYFALVLLAVVGWPGFVEAATSSDLSKATRFEELLLDVKRSCLDTRIVQTLEDRYNTDARLDIPLDMSASRKACYGLLIKAIDYVHPEILVFHTTTLTELNNADQDAAREEYLGLLRSIRDLVQQNEIVRDRIGHIYLRSRYFDHYTRDVSCLLIDIANLAPNLYLTNLLDSLNTNDPVAFHCGVKLLHLMNRQRINQVRFTQSSIKLLQSRLPDYPNLNYFYLMPPKNSQTEESVMNILKHLNRSISVEFATHLPAKFDHLQVLSLDNAQRVHLTEFDDMMMPTLTHELGKRKTGLEQLIISTPIYLFERLRELLMCLNYHQRKFGTLKYLYFPVQPQTEYDLQAMEDIVERYPRFRLDLDSRGYYFLVLGIGYRASRERF